jgi:hypothetical protein
VRVAVFDEPPGVRVIVQTRFVGHTGRVTAAAHHPTERYVLTGAGGDGGEADRTGRADRTVRAWDAVDGAELLAAPTTQLHWPRRAVRSGWTRWSLDARLVL